MKKKKLNLRKLNLQKAIIATLESNSVSGGFQSWTGTIEPCFSDFDCGTAFGCVSIGCPPTADCPPPQTNNCGTQHYTCERHTELNTACNGNQCYY
jgi:hypothetical protein